MRWCPSKVGSSLIWPVFINREHFYKHIHEEHCRSMERRVRVMHVKDTSKVCKSQIRRGEEQILSSRPVSLVLYLPVPWKPLNNKLSFICILDSQACPKPGIHPMLCAVHHTCPFIYIVCQSGFSRKREPRWESMADKKDIHRDPHMWEENNNERNHGISN